MYVFYSETMFIQKNDYIEELILSGNEIDNVGGTSIGKAIGE